MPNKRVLYLSGPMSGHEDDNFPAFDEAAEALRAAGYRVINPADLGPVRTTWADTLARDILLLPGVYGLAMLEGWGDSEGASLEHHVGIAFKKPAHSVQFWLRISQAAVRE